MTGTNLSDGKSALRRPHSLPVREWPDADRRAWEEACRAGSRLKPGGVLLVYVPAFPLLYSSMDRKVGHVRRYRHGRLVGLLGAAGLKVEFISHQDCLGFFAGLLFKLIGNDTGTFDRRSLVAYDRYVFPLSRRLDRLAGMFFGKNLLAVGRRHA